MPDFVCVGDATRDLFLFVEEASVNNGKLELGYGEKIPVSQTAWTLGGNAANVAVGLSRLGINTSLVTVFGDDDRGAWIKRELLKNNVDLSHSSTETGRESNLSTIIVFGGERTILSYHSTGSRQVEAVPDSQWIYLTSAPDKDSDDVFQIVLSKKKASPAVKVAFNPYVGDLKKGREYLAPIVAISDVLILNKEEAAMLGVKGPKVTVVTDGANGATVFEGEKKIQKPALGTKVLEPTGAGDAFSSGFLAALFKGKDLETALDWGLKNSASVIQKTGAIEGLLNYEEISR